MEQQPSNTPSLCYLQKNQENLTHENVCVISDHMKHDSNAVYTFLEKVLNKLEIKYQMLQKCVYFSDGPGPQYKNYKAFSNLCHHESDFGLNAEWNFFVTSHGKSPCDGIGGTVKCLVSYVSPQSWQEPIDTPLRMFEWCRKNIIAIGFIFVSHKEVESHIVHYGLEKRYLMWLKVPGTRSFHWYKPCSKTFQMHSKSISKYLFANKKTLQLGN